MDYTGNEFVTLTVYYEHWTIESFSIKNIFMIKWTYSFLILMWQYKKKIKHDGLTLSSCLLQKIVWPTNKAVLCRVSHRFWEHEGGRLNSILREHGGLINTCEGVHLTVKLPAISVQACKLLKMNFFAHFWRILAGF